jgi:hypothetical protein
VRGVPKLPPRDHYLIWREGKAPDFVIELTSKTTRKEDQTKKPMLYRDVMKVPENFLFDPTEDYLRPSLQGFRLIEGEYVCVHPVNPFLRPMLRSGHGGKGVDHGERSAGSRGVLERRPGSLATQRALGEGLLSGGGREHAGLLRLAAQARSV